MKKMILFAAAAIMAFGASAQMSLVKDLAKKAASNDPMELAAALEQIEPALTNPESAGDVLTWYTAGKAAFGLYDQMLALKSLGQPVEESEMGEVLIAAFDAYQKGLPLDTIVEVDKKTGQPKLNKDGSKKVKTKYSKEMIDAMIGHLGDIANLGNIYWGKEDWANAANAYGYFADLGSSAFAAANNVAQPDSTIAEVRCFQGFALYNAKEYAAAYDSFTKARKLGYTENNIVNFQNSALANMVQGMLDNNEYDKAFNFIDNALKSDPMNGTLHDIKGFTTELKDGVDAALPFYRRACEVDPTYANAFFDVGRCLYLQAQQIIDDNPNATNKELIPKIEPIYREAIPFLEKATQLNAEDTKAKNVLDDILYKFEIMGVKL